MSGPNRVKVRTFLLGSKRTFKVIDLLESRRGVKVHTGEVWNFEIDDGYGAERGL